MSFSRSRSKGSDYSYVSKETKQGELKEGLSAELTALGNKFAEDKKVLDDKLAQIESSDASDKVRTEAKKWHEEATKELQQQWREQVYEAQQKNMEQLRELSGEASAEASSLESLEASIDSMLGQMQATSLDGSSIKDELSSEKQAALDEKKKIDDELAAIQSGLTIQINIIQK